MAAYKKRVRPQSVMFWIVACCAFSFVVHAIGLFSAQFATGLLYPNEPLHSFAETAGGVFGLGVALLLVVMDRLGRGTSCNAPLVFGLAMMSMLDCLHAIAPPGESFVWLHSMATFAGGFHFASALLLKGRSDGYRMNAWAATAMLTASLALPFYPAWKPLMIVDQEFTVAAVFLNVGGGVLMIAAAVRYLRHYYVTRQDSNDLLFAMHCLLFGGAAIMFEQSQLWDFSWWWWHLLRLLAYTVALSFAVQSVLQLQLESRRLSELNDGRLEQAQDQAHELSTEVNPLRAVVDQHTLLSITDRSGKIIDVNKGFCLLSGYDRDELIGQNHRIVNSGVHPREFWIDMWKTVSSGRPWRGEVCNRDKDGSLYWVASTIVPWSSEPGQPAKRYVSLRFDITEKKKVEEDLRRAEKMSSIGRMTAGIAHEINTPMQFIGSSVSYLSRTMEKWSDLQAAVRTFIDSRDDDAIDRLHENLVSEDMLQDVDEALADCRLGVQRVSEIVGAMKEFAHPGGDDHQPFAINRCVENAATLTKNATKQHAMVELDLAECELVQGSASAMSQTLVNLIVNAADAIEEASEGGTVSGRITVSTRQLEDRVVVRVADTGCGMPPEVAAKAFDPFFTTKGVGKGSGQGLAIAYNAVVEKCGGEIKIDSNPGEGTTFVISLPVACPEGSLLGVGSATS